MNWKNLIIYGLLLISSSKDVAAKTDTVIMGQIAGNLLYVTTYANTHKMTPKNLYIYLNGIKTTARLRENTPLIEPYKHESDSYSEFIGVGRFVYEIDTLISEDENLKDVIVFLSNRKIIVKDKILYEKNTRKSWYFTNELYSNEGVHTVLTTTKNGRCVSHIDYYYYFPYDVMPSSQKEWRRAACGRPVRQEDVHF
jgi:hypothetical protein